MIKGQHIAEHVKLYVAAASDEVEQSARKRGYWQTLLDAGATPLPPGCGACIGLGQGVLEPGEVGISATNRNFKGRMGSRDAQVYLASPEVVAASAVAGKIASPARSGLSAAEIRSRLEQGSRATAARGLQRSASAVKITPGFPQRLEGELLFVPRDNLNTDGIYGKEYTYKEGMSSAEMGRAAMENYDPEFQGLAREGDLLVGGYNFGSGSSREQAATALKHRGLQMIIAGSFSQTYKRNAFNNGYICIECPGLVDALKAAHADNQSLTIRTGWRGVVDFEKACVTCGGRSHGFAPLGDVAQELIVKGGFEAVIRDQLREA